MIIKSTIRSNVAIAAHPEGCKKYVNDQIDYVLSQKKIEGPKNVLVIGGSSGYGLGSRIALAFGANANTINVSFETGPRGRMTGSAGWWNNIAFQQAASKANIPHKDFIGDAFSYEMKDEVIKYIKETCQKVDLVVYSLASGVRVDPKTGIKYTSALKAIGQPVVGKTIDIAKKSLIEQTMAVATQEEIDNTVKVMGGEDWEMWIDALVEADVLEQNAKTVAYTYIGAPCTFEIYRDGTIGQAKRHLELTGKKLNEKLAHTINGQAYLCSSKTVVTKASTFIPIVPIYASCLFKVMKEQGCHESIIEHKYRLFADMLYGENLLLDEKGIIRLDSYELQPHIQEVVDCMMKEVTEDNFYDLCQAQSFIDDFMHMNGFGYDVVDYDADVDMESLATIKLI